VFREPEPEGATRLDRRVAERNEVFEPYRSTRVCGASRVSKGRCRTRALLMLVLGVFVVISTAACVSKQPRLEPTRIIDDAHYGGNALAVSPDGRVAASGGWAGRIRLWQFPGGAPVVAWQTSHGDLSGLMFLPGGDRLLSTGRDGFVRIWDLNGRLLTTYAVGSAVTSFHPGGDSGSVILGHANGRVSHWRVDGQSLGLWELSGRRITAVATDRSGTLFAAGDSTGGVWRWRGDESPEQLQSPPSHARSLVFDPIDGGLLGSGWFDLFSWSVDGVELQVIPTAHRGIVNHLAFIGDGPYVASISRQTDSAVLLLDPESGETLVGFKKHELCGQRLALSPDGRFMISNSDDASVRFYTLPEMPAQFSAGP